MRSDPSRRSLLTAALGGAIGVGLPLVGCGPADTASLVVTPLADGLILVSGAGANVVAARGPNGAVMVDGGLAAHADQLARTIARELGTRDVAALFNTHWHPEHTGSNQRLGAQGAPIFAHENTRLWLTQTIERPWEDFAFAPAPAEALPTQTFYDKGQMILGDERIEYGYLSQAHTDGDIYVFFREANVLVAGGAVSGAGWPLIDWWTGGWIGSSSATMNANVVQVGGGMVPSLTTLASLADDETRIVPGDGPVLTRADLEGQVAMYSKIAADLREMLFKAYGPEDVIAAAPTAEFDAVMGDPEQFLTLAFQSMWGHFTPDA
jgi:glyoxylase-like metal-dependent hydrolase (beta-lactamase superfamily II)